MIHHDRSPYLYHWFNHLTSLAFHIAFGAYLHVEIVRSQRSWKVDVLAWSFVLLACVIAVISSWAKPWCGMTWYLLVYTISAINTRKKKLWIAQLLAFRSNAELQSVFQCRSLYLCCTSLLSSMQIPAWFGATHELQSFAMLYYKQLQFIEVIQPTQPSMKSLLCIAKSAKNQL
jgi:hypothetical protein